MRRSASPRLSWVKRCHAIVAAWEAIVAGLPPGDRRNRAERVLTANLRLVAEVEADPDAPWAGNPQARNAAQVDGSRRRRRLGLSLISGCEIDPTADVGPFTNLYGCKVGADAMIGPFVEIQEGVVVGARCRVQSHSFLCTGVTLEDDVFVGHGVVFTNDRWPAVADREWLLERTTVRAGASIGSGAVVLPGVTIGARATVGAGAVVTRSVLPGDVVAGVPARTRARPTSAVS